MQARNADPRPLLWRTGGISLGRYIARTWFNDTTGIVASVIATIVWIRELQRSQHVDLAILRGFLVLGGCMPALLERVFREPGHWRRLALLHAEGVTARVLFACLEHPWYLVTASVLSISTVVTLASNPAAHDTLASMAVYGASLLLVTWLTPLRLRTRRRRPARHAWMTTRSRDWPRATLLLARSRAARLAGVASVLTVLVGFVTELSFLPALIALFWLPLAYNALGADAAAAAEHRYTMVGQSAAHAARQVVWTSWRTLVLVALCATAVGIALMFVVSAPERPPLDGIMARVFAMTLSLGVFALNAVPAVWMSVRDAYPVRFDHLGSGAVSGRFNRDLLMLVCIVGSLIVTAIVLSGAQAAFGGPAVRVEGRVS